MSKAKLKKYLQQTLSKEQVIEVMIELYDARKEVKEYLEFYLAPDSNAELEKCKKAIRQEFFPTRGFSEKPSFAKCRKIISDFQKLKTEPTYVADLMLFYIEQGCEYTVTFGDMWEQYYTTLESNFNKAMKFIFMHGLLATYYERIEKLLNNASNCGWGFYDTLSDITNIGNKTKESHSLLRYVKNGFPYFYSVDSRIMRKVSFLYSLRLYLSFLHIQQLHGVPVD